MDITTLKSRRPAYAVCLIGPAGSGKTQQGCTFPKVYYIGTDPTGLDSVLWNPQNAKLATNVVAGNVLNGLPLADVFAEDETSSSSIYGNIAIATEMAARGEVKTIFLDNLTYLIDPMYWQHIDGDKKVGYGRFGEVATFASDLVLSRLLPLATQAGINIVISMHVQRESKDAVEGASEIVKARAEGDAKKAEQLGQQKRHVNKNSDLSPMVLGSLRQKIGGMPSAMIWLNSEEADVEVGGKAVRKLVYHAYCQKQYVEAWDTEVEAKNRYGLDRTLVMTDASLYASLVQASKQAMEKQKQLATAAAAKAARVTNQGESPQPELAAVTSPTPVPNGQQTTIQQESKS